jgi:hypothetical protein
MMAGMPKTSQQLREELTAAKRNIADAKNELRAYKINRDDAIRGIHKIQKVIKCAVLTSARLKNAIPKIVKRERAAARRAKAASKKTPRVAPRKPIELKSSAEEE